MWIDHAEQKSKIQAERVQKKYDGSQAPSCMDTNLAIGPRQAMVYHTIILDFYFKFNIFMLRMIVHYVDRSWLEP
jgi:hypothetical protein